MPSPLRVFLHVSSKSDYYSKAWDEIKSNENSKVVSAAVQALIDGHIVDSGDEGIQPRVMAVNRWPRFIHIVFDLFYDTYDAKTGDQLEKNTLPVHQLLFTKKDGKESCLCSAVTDGIRQKVNHEIMNFHILNGYDKEPPFFEDHTNGNVPIYRNSRRRL